ncbi:L-talarate/galactarate dehydratase [Kineosporia babensis]|uniref:L-talarate/galactarate dehydratase n=1 Tax=Kineosporia babensis TaxID=499548 RepID=UPI0022B07D32|nr:mandelate racemase/muconate lactonizing enzyme family protein [Kineosporia babensis]
MTLETSTVVPDLAGLHLGAGEATSDRITGVRTSLAYLPLGNPISDAKVFTGRQKPLTEIAFVFAEITTESGITGLGWAYSKRAGGPGMYAHARELAGNLLGEDPSDIARIWTKLVWAGASVGRSGLSVQAIAAFDVALWDIKGKRAGLPLAKLIGAHRDTVAAYNTSGGFLSMPIEAVVENTQRSVANGIGGIKLKVGQPDRKADLARVAAVREAVGDDFTLMVDANQQWNRQDGLRMGRALEEFRLEWIEEPLDAYDAEGHAQLAAALDTPIATGEMLTSVAEHAELLRLRSVDYLQPDAPRVGGITPFLKLLALAEHAGVSLAPHFAMEIHVHLSAAYPHTSWVEHFEWLEPLWNERLELREGRMVVPARAGLGLSLSEQARAWTIETSSAGSLG